MEVYWLMASLIEFQKWRKVQKWTKKTVQMLTFPFFAILAVKYKHFNVPNYLYSPVFRKKKQADKQKVWIIKVYDFRHFRCQFYLLSPYRNKIWLDIIRSTKYWCIHQILFSRPISEYCSPHKSLFTWIMLRGLNPKGCESCFLSKNVSRMISIYFNENHYPY